MVLKEKEKTDILLSKQFLLKMKGFKISSLAQVEDLRQMQPGLIINNF